MRPERTEITRDAAYEEIRRLRAEFADKAATLHEFNEAKTRLLLIDRILECVGWSKSQFNPETPSGSAGYTDYLLSLENEPKLVVEAKRAGQTFVLANRRLTKNVYQLTYVRSAFGQSLTDVLEQAERYARQHHVPFAVLSNGKEWIAVQLSPSPGQSVEDLKCVYFGNLLTEESNFELFWGLLSAHAVGENALAEQFADLNAQEADFSATPRAELGHFTWKPACSPETRVEDFYRLFFDEIVDPARRQMLEYCFVSSSKLDQYEGSLKRVLKDAAPKYLEGAADLAPGDREALLRGNLGDRSGRVILVTGSVGCGKSTFIHKVLVESRQDERIQAVMVDLIDDHDPPDATSLLWRRVHEAWRHDVPTSLQYAELKKIFRVQLKELKKGPQAQIFEADPSAYTLAEGQRLQELSVDTESFLSACWHYAAEHGKGVVLFLDNVDRTSKAFQRDVYNFAHRIARLTGATVIVPMRESTYFRGKESDFLDVRTSDLVFHLQAPDPLQVIARRIRYVETHVEEDHRYAHFKNDIERFRGHAATLKGRVLGQTEDRSLIQVLSALAWHDIRSFLALLRQVHVALGKEHPWSTENVLAALMTAESPVGSIRIPNLYKPPYPTYPSLFVRTRILAALLYAPRADQLRHGVSLHLLLRFLRGAGYHERWTRRALEELVQERLLECLEAPAGAEYAKDYRIESHHSYRPSPLAVLLMERLQVEPIYLALIGADLTYHSKKAYDAYVKAKREFLSAIDGSELEPTAVALLSGSVAPELVGAYLAEAFRREQPLAEISKYQADSFAIESKLRDTLELLVGFTGGKKASSRPPSPLVKNQQLELVLSNEAEVQPAPATVPPCPVYLRDKVIDGSTLAPAIFWSLVVLDAQGQKWVTGAEITRAMNQHVFSDQERKEPTNVSRALRHPVLRDQPWLVVTGKEKHWRYSLAANWLEHWRTLFGCAPPKI